MYGRFFASSCQIMRMNTLRTTKKVQAITWSSLVALAIMKWISRKAHCGRTKIKRIILAFSLTRSYVALAYYSQTSAFLNRKVKQLKSFWWCLSWASDFDSCEFYLLFFSILNYDELELMELFSNYNVQRRKLGRLLIIYRSRSRFLIS